VWHPARALLVLAFFERVQRDARVKLRLAKSLKRNSLCH